MDLKKINIALVACVFLTSCIVNNSLTDNNKRLWYTYPAEYWNSQALHLGNGYLGASFFGGIADEKLAISEASMWTGGPANGDWEKAGVNPEAKKSLPLIRKAVLDGKIKMADSLVSDNFFGSLDNFGHFTSVGELNIHFINHESEPGEYIRSLDLANSLGTVSYKINNTHYNREYFCSYPDRLLAMRFIADKRGAISFDLGMKIIQDSSETVITDNIFMVRGTIDNNLRPFNVLIYIYSKGGVVNREGQMISVREADTAEIYLAVATNYKMIYPDYTGDDPELITRKIIKNIEPFNYEQIKKRHVEDYRSLFDRVNFELASGKKTESLPTNERFQRLKSGGSDPGYKVLAFNLGRYMIISSSRPNTLPANLQGVWNYFKAAPWSGNYQSNINLQEIYWSCGPTDLAECQEAYTDWIENLAISGREIAQRVYGTAGWVSHTTGNIWGHAAPAGSHPWGMFPMGAVWHCQHIWDQFAFTQDTVYLRDKAFPLLREAAIFWLENLIPFNDYSITAPSVSAEHGALITKDGLNPAYHDYESNNYCYCLPGAYQDIEMLWDLFTNTSDAARIIGYPGFADSLMNIRDKLLPLKIGRYGQLQEWYEDIDNPDCHHRHIAHLYAVHPGRQIHPAITPELAEAARKSLDMRGDGRFPDQETVSGGNWARAHRMWCWTRLMEGNRANRILTGLLTEQGFENGLTFQHAPFHQGGSEFLMEDELNCHFQLDASASVPGCIAEMLVQSHLGKIHLLPALPDEFKSGKISGLKARGGYKINLAWKNGELSMAEIYIPKGLQTPSLMLKNKQLEPMKFKSIKFKDLVSEL